MTHANSSSRGVPSSAAGAPGNALQREDDAEIEALLAALDRVCPPGVIRYQRPVTAERDTAPSHATWGQVPTAAGARSWWFAAHALEQTQAGCEVFVLVSNRAPAKDATADQPSLIEVQALLARQQPFVVSWLDAGDEKAAEDELARAMALLASAGARRVEALRSGARWYAVVDGSEPMTRVMKAFAAEGGLPSAHRTWEAAPRS